MKKGEKFFTLSLSLVLLLGLAGAGCNSSQPNSKPIAQRDVVAIKGFALYDNNAEGFRIQYPQNWTMEEGASGTLVAFKSPQDTGDTFLENVNIVIEDISQAGKVTLKDYEDAALALLKEASSKPDANLADIKKVDGKEITIDNTPARYIAYTSTFKPNSSKLYSRQYFTIKNGKVYIITYTASQQKPDTFMDLVKSMVDSFQITK